MPNLAFVALRTEQRKKRYCAVVECNPKSDRLVLHALGEDENPLDVLASERRREEIRQTIAKYTHRREDSEETDGLIELVLSEVVVSRDMK